MNLYPILCENYNEISRTFYDKYKAGIEKYRDSGCIWDFNEHTPEENYDYRKTRRDTYNSALGAIVFQAIAVEAFVNLFGAYRLGDEVFYSDIEKTGATTSDKLKNIYRRLYGGNYPTNTVEYNRLMSLLNKRNRIVHTKPKALSMQDEEITPNYGVFMEQVDFIFSNIDDEMKSYETLKRTIRELENKECDLIHEIDKEIEQALKEGITSMINSVF